MSAPPLAPELMQEALDAKERYGTNRAAARALGLPNATFESRLSRARLSKLTPSPGIVSEAPTKPNPLEPIVEQLRLENDRLKEALQSAMRPRFVIRQDTQPRTEKLRCVVIGDAHDSPPIPKERFEWIGSYINETKPDIVVQIGDFCTLDSLNSHIPNESYQGKAKPSFIADMVSFNQALGALDSKLNYKCEKHCTLGNHERRLYHFEDRAPEAYGMMQAELQGVFDRYGWTISEYGLITYYGGVGFVHAALNRLGKTMGGKTAEVTIANESTHDLVVGHSHVERIHRAPKIGVGNFVQILNVGCALPDGHVESYATHALTGWSWGIMDITIQHGHISDRQWVSMARLEEKHGRP